MTRRSVMALSSHPSNAYSNAPRGLPLDHLGQAAVDAARIAFEYFRLVLRRQRQLVDVALGVVVVVTGFRIDAANRADHFRGEQDVVDRDDLRQQLLAGQVIDASVEEDV